MSGTTGRQRVPIESQDVAAPLTSTAVFLVLTVRDGDDATETVRGVLADVGGLIKTVAFRDLSASFACTVGIGSRIWDDVVRRPRPAELHPFRPFSGAVHEAPATPGDLLFHVRAERRDLCFEFERLLLDALAGAVDVADETVGFRYFDVRDLLGFVDGTANPVGQDLPESTVVGPEDPAGTGGSYVVVQKYTHPLAAWEALGTEHQEAIIGRRKADNLELDDVEQGQKAHKTLTTIVDDNGDEQDILRDNMPFGSPATGDVGTYFIGYARRLWVIEAMLERMFVGDPPGLHDRLLDFSTAVTGSTFFVPPAAQLATLADDPPTATADPPGTGGSAGPADGSLGIGGHRPAPTEGASR
ncbi:MAG: Dyp-type peroxidase [Curtobacterium sp.]